MYLYYSSTNKCIILDNKYLAVGKFVLIFSGDNTKVSLLSTDGIEFMFEKLITELQDEHDAYYADKADFLNKIGSSFFYINTGTMSDTNWTRTAGDNPFLSPTNAGDDVILTGDFTTPVIHPTADSTTAFKFTNAEKSIDLFVLDSTNKKFYYKGGVFLKDDADFVTIQTPNDITNNSVLIGDVGANNNKTLLEISDKNKTVQISTDTNVKISNALKNKDYLNCNIADETIILKDALSVLDSNGYKVIVTPKNSATGNITIGDIDGSYGGAYMSVEGTNKKIKFSNLVSFYDKNSKLTANFPADLTANSVKFGDVGSQINSTILEIDDANSKVKINSANGFQTQKADGSIASHTISVSLTDSNELEPEGSYYDLVTSKSGYARMFFGNAEGYADFIFSTTGVVTFINVSDNCYKTLQTGTNHVIIKDNGNNVRIVNEMGASKNFTLIIMYN